MVAYGKCKCGLRPDDHDAGRGLGEISKQCLIQITCNYLPTPGSEMERKVLLPCRQGWGWSWVFYLISVVLFFLFFLITYLALLSLPTFPTTFFLSTSPILPTVSLRRPLHYSLGAPPLLFHSILWPAAFLVLKNSYQNQAIYLGHMSTC